MVIAEEDRRSNTCKLPEISFIKFKMKCIEEKSNNIAKINELIVKFLKAPYIIEPIEVRETDIIAGFHLHKDNKRKLQKWMIDKRVTFQDVVPVLIEKYIGGK